MRITDPQSLLDQLNFDELTRYLRYNPLKDSPASLKKFHLQTEPEVMIESTQAVAIEYHEPYGIDSEKGTFTETVGQQLAQEISVALPTESNANTTGIIKEKVMRLGDFIDTDAVSIVTEHFFSLSWYDRGYTSPAIFPENAFKMTEPSQSTLKNG